MRITIQRAARRLLQLLLGLAGLLLCLVLAWLALKAWVQWRGPSASQRQALALIDQPVPARPGTDGFAALWLLQRDVPQAQWDEWLARDVASFAAHDAQQAEGAWQQPSAALPKLAAQSALSCKPFEGNCLAQVRAKPEAYAAWVAQQAALLDRVEALASHGHLGQPFEQRPELLFPPYHYLSWPFTRFAWQFAQARDGQVHAAGRAAQQTTAMAGLCRYSAAMQRLLTQPGQFLLPQMIAAANVRQGGQLLADMLHEAGPTQTVPPDCLQAFAPDANANQAMCHTVRAEWAIMRSLMQHMPSSWPWDLFGMRTWRSVVIGLEAPAIAGWTQAERLAPYCMPAFAQAFDLDQRPPVPHTSISHLECAASPTACGNDVDETWQHYADRLHDREAMRRAVASLLWLRQGAAHVPPDQWLADARRRWPSRPAALHMPGADAQWVDAPAGTGQPARPMLRTPLRDTDRGPNFDLPL